MEKHWKQTNPFDQLTVIRASMEGHLLNFQENRITKDKLIERIENHLNEIRLLEPFLCGIEKWGANHVNS